MNKCIGRNLTIKLSIILIICSGFFFTKRSAGQPIRGKTNNVYNQILPYKKCWSYKRDLSNYRSASDNEFIYLPIASGKIVALNLTSGVMLWETSLGGEIYSDVVINNVSKDIYVLTKTSASSGVKYESNKNFTVKISDSNTNNNVSILKLSSLSKNTGISSWQINLTTQSISSPQIFVYVFNKRIITADQNGEINIISESDGKLLYKKVSNPKLNDARYFLQNDNLIQISKNEIVILSTETYIPTFTKKTNSILTAVYLSNKNILTLGNTKGEVFTIDIKAKKTVWENRYGAEISHITSTPKGLLITSLDNFVYLISPKSGKQIWKRRLEGRLIIEPLIVGGSVIITTLGSSKASLLDLNSGLSVNQIPLSADNFFVNQPMSINDLFVFPTAEGLISLSDSERTCSAG